MPSHATPTPAAEPGLDELAAALHAEDLIGVCFHEADGKGFAGGERECIRVARAIRARLRVPAPEGVSAMTDPK